ncbi:branched-chain amino acid ABC transporter substrate-binding protein [Protofrankia sp. BMG5.30]|uniref:branched-chain amino acid ABC transporter substrate-binding protein n=1 Tax=Protofrankia sp. BMG5.30 TaxID=1834514 RepID=UPI0009FA2A60|nr:branched-chain amino acid ABC transporter substrate-binding protein [Protofrankia sp. BMG5.30]
MAIRTVTAAAAGVLAVALSAGACGGGLSGGRRAQYAIGFQGPLSGADQQFGLDAANGARTAVEQANRSGRLPFTLRLVTADDSGSARQAPSAAQTLIDNPDVIAVVGPLSSDAVRASEALYSQAGLLSVSPAATDPRLTGLGFVSFYRMAASDTVQGTATADYVAKALKSRKVFSLDDGSAYGTALSGAFEKELRTQGVAVTHDTVGPTRDYTVEAAKIISGNPDTVFYAGYHQEFAPLTGALRAGGFSGAVMSGDGATGDRFVTEAGAASAEGAYLIGPCGDPVGDPRAAGFVADYERVTGGVKPGTCSGEAYDATSAVVEALRALGPEAGRDAVTQTFASVDIQGVTRRVAFAPNGDIADTVVYVYQVRSGRRNLLGTTAALIGP